jgi:predicted ATPase
MEKLIVKNFGPIKEAEIDLTKYVVFIGDTSTGKSILAKLITIFRENDLLFSSNRKKEFKKLLNYYNIDFNKSNTFIQYELDKFSIIYQKGNIKVFEQGKLFEFKDDQVKNMRKDSIITLAKDMEMLLADDKFKDNEELKKLRSSFDNFFTNHRRLLHSFPLYIPAERMLVSLVGNSISGLWSNNVALPSCFKDFAAKFEVAKNEIKTTFFESLKLGYNLENDLDYITYGDTKLRLTQSSSGIQSLIPMLLVLSYELNFEKSINKTVLIEEPELNLFPIKQKQLLEFIISMFSTSGNKLVITTHSPYILSVLDTLLLAKNTFKEHKNLKKEIGAIISEDKWIDYNDISVYEVKNDGKIRSIKNEEFRSIDANSIDGVSDIISEEFDKLTELRYAQ